MKNILAISISLLALAGCMNMPTAPAQIAGTYVSTMKYEHLECPRLKAELDSVSRRETHLVMAQEQRIKSSSMQAFWYGYGQGDGVEAAELSQIRGEKEAIRKTMDAKSCSL